MNDAKLEELLTQKRIKDLQTIMGPLAKYFKNELLKNKSHTLASKDFKIEDIFGSLICADEIMVI